MDENKSILPDENKSLWLFFKELCARQEPLGDPFEKILHDNLWELYAR